MEEKRSHQIVQALLSKPSNKPNFASLPQSSILKKAQTFLPEFIQSTDKILSDPNLCMEKQMDVKIAEQEDVNPEFFNDMKKHIPLEGQPNDKQTVQMDIGVGVFDVKEKLGSLLEK